MKRNPLVIEKESSGRWALLKWCGISFARVSIENFPHIAFTNPTCARARGCVRMIGACTWRWCTRARMVRVYARNPLGIENESTGCGALHMQCEISFAHVFVKNFIYMTFANPTCAHVLEDMCVWLVPVHTSDVPVIT